MFTLQISNWIANFLVFGIACVIWLITIFLAIILLFEILLKIKELIWKD